MRVLLLNQCFYPDVVSTAQHAADLAVALSCAGHQVTVVTSRRAYDDPTSCFSATENWRGLSILRVWSAGLGKSTKWRRAVNFASFLASAGVAIARLQRYETVVAMTSPPLISFLAAAFTRLKGGHLCLWIMDLNPDEAVAAGWLSEKSFVNRFLTTLLKYSLRQADTVIVLDRFMRERIVQKGIEASKICVLPPWSHDQSIAYDADGRKAFRSEHGLEGKYVVMYSGNHSPCHPLDTLLHAALRLRDRQDIAFCFIGGGSEFRKVKEFTRANRLANIVQLPYQPLQRLSASLSSADLHVVVMGDPFVGIVHPCKVYNIVSLDIPFLYIGPSPSHVTDLLSDGANKLGVGLAQHGDVEAVVWHVATNAKGRVETREPSAREAAHAFSQESIIPRMVRVIANQNA